MTLIRVNPEAIESAAKKINASAGTVNQAVDRALMAASQAPSYQGEFAPQLSQIASEARARGEKITQYSTMLEQMMAEIAQRFLTVDRYAQQTFAGLLRLFDGPAYPGCALEPSDDPADPYALIRDMDEAACWEAFDHFQAQFPDLTLDPNAVDYEALQAYIEGYDDPDAQRWLGEALLTLVHGGPQGQAGANYLMENNVEIRIVDFDWWQQGMGVRWTMDGVIEMRADKISWSDPVPIHELPGLVHEAKHLEQGKWLALTQLGEVQAWNLQYEVGQELGIEFSWIPEEVAAWGDDPSFTNFQAASNAIIESQGWDYMFWMLPPWPGYLISQSVPKEIRFGYDNALELLP